MSELKKFNILWAITFILIFIGTLSALLSGGIGTIISLMLYAGMFLVDKIFRKGQQTLAMRILYGIWISIFVFGILGATSFTFSLLK